MENIKEIKKKVNDTDVNKELLKIFKEGEAENFFPGYLVNEIEDHCGEIVITMVTSTEDSPEADRFKKFTEGGNIEIGECDGDVYIFCYGYDEGSKQFRIRFNWDGTERDFKDKLDIYLKELGYKIVNVYNVSDWENKSIVIDYSICEKNEDGDWVDMEGNLLGDEEIDSIEELNIGDTFIAKLHTQSLIFSEEDIEEMGCTPDEFCNLDSKEQLQKIKDFLSPVDDIHYCKNYSGANYDCFEVIGSEDELDCFDAEIDHWNGNVNVIADIPFRFTVTENGVESKCMW